MSRANDPPRIDEANKVGCCSKREGQRERRREIKKKKRIKFPLLE